MIVRVDKYMEYVQWYFGRMCTYEFLYPQGFLEKFLRWGKEKFVETNFLITIRERLYW